jgi:putative ABC transport system permease protein
LKITDIFSYSFSAIKLRKLRAGLTILGVVIGIAAIVALLSVSTGLQTTITGQLEKGLAADTLIVTPATGGFGSFNGGGTNSGGGGFGGGSEASSGFKLFINYTSEINGLSPDIITSFAVIQQPGYIQNNAGEIRQINGGVSGVNFSQYKDIFSTTFVAASGSISPNPQDDDVVVGARVSDPRLNGTTFVTENENVKIMWTNATSFPFVNETYSASVSAVLRKIGGFSLAGPADNGVYVPISKAETFFGTNQATMIVVKLKSSDNATITSVTKLINDHFSNQVSVTSATAILDLLNTIFGTITIFLAGIAAISLLVAGIGIMNIMIVSLIERTREIGILKALGMKSRTVLSIFLCESVIIGLIGAFVGVATGWGLANVVAAVFGRGGGPFGGGGAAASSGINITPILTPEVFLLAIGFGISVSIIFALYPAWRASRLKPVDALRYE